jgi:hypothetical protein
LRTISRRPLGQPLRQPPSSSATQAPARISPSGSTAGVQAGGDSGVDGIGDGHPDRVGQPPGAASRRTRRCRRLSRCGSGSAVRAGTSSAAAPGQAGRPRCGRRRCCCLRSRGAAGRRLAHRTRPRPWSTNPISGWWPKVFFQVAAASCFSECAITSTPSRSTTTCPAASGAASPANVHTYSRT